MTSCQFKPSERSVRLVADAIVSKCRRQARITEVYGNSELLAFLAMLDGELLLASLSAQTCGNTFEALKTRADARSLVFILGLSSATLPVVNETIEDILPGSVEHFSADYFNPIIVQLCSNLEIPERVMQGCKLLLEWSTLIRRYLLNAWSSLSAAHCEEALFLGCRLAGMWRYLDTLTPRNHPYIANFFTVALPTILKKSRCFVDTMLASLSGKDRHDFVEFNLLFVSGCDRKVMDLPTVSIEEVFLSAKAPAWKWNGFLRPLDGVDGERFRTAFSLLSDGYTYSPHHTFKAPEDVLRARESPLTKAFCELLDTTQLSGLYNLLSVARMQRSIVPAAEKFHMPMYQHSTRDHANKNCMNELDSMIKVVHRMLWDPRNSTVSYLHSNISEKTMDSLIAMEVELGHITGSALSESELPEQRDVDGTSASSVIVMLPSESANIFRRNWGISSAFIFSKCGVQEEEQRFLSRLNEMAVKALCSFALEKNADFSAAESLYLPLRSCLTKLQLFLEGSTRRGLIPSERSSLYLGVVFSTNECLVSDSAKTMGTRQLRSMYVDTFLASWAVSRHEILASFFEEMWSAYSTDVVLSTSLSSQIASSDTHEAPSHVPSRPNVAELLSSSRKFKMLSRVLDADVNRVTISNVISQTWRAKTAASLSAFITSRDEELLELNSRLIVSDVALFFSLYLLPRKRQRSLTTSEEYFCRSVVDAEWQSSISHLKGIWDSQNLNIRVSTDTVSDFFTKLGDFVRSEPKWRSLGEMWGLYGCTKAQLEHPFRHLDPLLRQHVKATLHEAAASSADAYMKEAGKSEQSIYGSVPPSDEDFLVSTYSSLKSELEKTQECYHARIQHQTLTVKSRTQYEHVIMEIESIKSNFVNFEKFQEKLDLENELIRDFIDSIRSSLRRLKMYEDQFSDVVHPFSSACYQMILGLEVLIRSCEDDDRQNESSHSLTEFRNAVMTLGQRRDSACSSAHLHVATESLNKLFVEKILDVSLHGISTESDGGVQHLENADASKLILDEAEEFDSLFFESSEDKQKEGQSHSRRKRPPDAANTILRVVESMFGSGSHVCKMPAPSLGHRMVRRLQEWLFGEQDGHDLDMMERAFCIVDTLNVKSSVRKEKPIGLEFWMNLADVRDNMWEEMKEAYDPAKSEEAKNVLERYLARVCYLLREFPGDARLSMLATAADRALQCRYDTTVGSLLTLLESLLQNSYKWENSQSKRYTLGNALQNLQKLITKWRENELASWEYVLLQQEKLRCERASSWWGYLLKSVYEHMNSCDDNSTYANAGAWCDPEETEISRENMANKLLKLYDLESISADAAHGLFRLVENFLRGSPVGEYPTRVIMIRLAVDTVGHRIDQSAGVAHRIHASLRGIARYYSQYLPYFREVVAKRRKEISDKLKESQKIHRWDEQTYYSLKESIDKSKKLLQKYAREYRGLLNSRVNDLLQSDPDRMAAIVTEDVDKEGYQLSEVSMPPEVVKETTSSVYADRSGILSPDAQKLREDEIQDLDEKCTTIIERMASLRQDADASKSLKKRALIELLQFLKGTFQFSESPIQRCCQYPEFLLEIPLVGEQQNDPSADMDSHGSLRFVSQKCDDYFYRTVDSVQRMRLAFSSGVHEDVSDILTDRNVRRLDHLQLIVNEERLQACKLLRHQQLMRQMLASLKYLRRPSSLRDSPQATFLKECRDSSLELMSCVEQVSQLLEKHEQAAASCDIDGNDVIMLRRSEAADMDHVVCWMKDQVSLVKTIAEDIDRQIRLYCDTRKTVEQISGKKVEGFNLSFDAEGCIVAAEERVGSLKTELRRMVSQIASDYRSPLFSRLLNNSADLLERQIYRVLQAYRSRESLREQTPHRIPSLDTGAVVRALSTDVQSLDLDATDALWGKGDDQSFAVIEEHTRRVRTMDRLRFPFVTHCLEAALRQVPRESPTSEDALREVEQIVNMCERWSSTLLKSCLRMQKTLLKLLYVVSRTFSTIFKEGLCLPNDQEDDGATQTQGQDLTEGTGIGQGEGQQDVSSQIENEEQVLGLRNEQEETGKDEVEEEKEGLEMSEDFEGTEHNREENAEQEEDDQEENEEELDREMGQVDGDDEEVVDASKPENEEANNEEELRPKEDTNVDSGDTSKQEEEIQAQEDTEQQIEDSNVDQEDGNEEEAGQADSYVDYEEGNEVDNEANEANDEQEEANEFSDDMNMNDKDEESAESDNEELNQESEEVPDEERQDEENGKIDEMDEHTEEAPKDEAQTEGIDDNVDPKEHNGKTESLEEGGFDERGQGNTSSEGDTGGGSGAQPEREKEDTEERNEKSREEDAKESSKGNDRENSPRNGAKGSEDLQSFENPTHVVGEWKAKLENLKLSDDTAETSDQQPPSNSDEAVFDEKSGDIVYQPSSIPQQGQEEETGEKPEESSVQAGGDQEQQSEHQAVSQHAHDAEPRDTLPKEEDGSERGSQEIRQKEGSAGQLPSDEPQDLDKSMASEYCFDTDHISANTRADAKEDDASIVANTMPGQHRLHDAQNMDVAEMTNKMKRMREQVQQDIQKWGKDRSDYEEAVELWQRLKNMTLGGATHLCESLRLVLEPTLASKMKGDYRTGKRINMRKVIPFIASGYRKDKIWLRRTKPSDRTYQVMLAVDDSLSMRENGAAAVALESLSLVTQALTKLEVGQIAVAKFGSTCELLHPFDMPFTDESGARVVSRFSFEQSRTATADVLESIIKILDDSQNSIAQSSTSITGSSVMQLVFLISDGILTQEKSERIRQWTIEAAEKNQLLVLLLIDSEDPQNSVLNTERIEYGGSPSSPRIIRKRYLDDFPFPYYLVVSHVNQLPEALGNGLKQWFDLVANKE
eukprot:gb/GECG01013116.1/.p1 GENE.gb/GECG01013116.1/~~gb/GECG01013116.1/.p1  ORF type:complete len:2837 (+),score=464.98 gb/GECG01013116.1/:1-8511(+)